MTRTKTIPPIPPPATGPAIDELADFCVAMSGGMTIGGVSDDVRAQQQHIRQCNAFITCIRLHSLLDTVPVMQSLKKLCTH